MLNGTIVEDRREIANSCNNYFTSIVSKLNECDYIKSSSNISIYLKECTSDDILNIIKELSSSKSSDIPITVLKRCGNILSPVLSKFYTRLMRLGIFPDTLKTGLVILVPYIKKVTLNY